MIDKVYGMLGFARKSGKLLFGFDAVMEGIIRNKIELVIIAQDASTKNSQKIQKNCQTYDIHYVECGEKLRLGQLLNKSEVSFIGLRDKNMAEYIRNLY